MDVPSLNELSKTSSLNIDSHLWGSLNADKNVFDKRHLICLFTRYIVKFILFISRQRWNVATVTVNIFLLRHTEKYLRRGHVFVLPD